MARSIEELVLSMQFDNKQFQDSAQDTLSTLDALKKSTDPKNFAKVLLSSFSKKPFDEVKDGADNATKSIKEVSDSVKDINFLPLASGIKQAGQGFNALQSIAFGAFAAIGYKATQVGSQLVQAFTIRPVMEGFGEYETKINAIQRIQANTASKGTSMETITASLDDLNEYADRTIYNFGEMTDAIARFTTSGVDVEEAATSIKGLSNLAALSGVTAAESARVNKQISQALGGGDVRLQDWMSVENAGMDSEAFKTALFESAKNLGTLGNIPMDQTFEEWTKSGHNFRESLKDGWLEVSVLTDALENMSGEMDKDKLLAKGFSDEVAEMLLKNAEAAESSARDIRTLTQLNDTLKEAAGSAWVGVFESVFGELEDAKKLFTAINDALEPIVTKLPNTISNAFTEWADIGGRAEFFDAFKTLTSKLSTVVEPISEAFGEVFSPLSGEHIKRVTDAFKDFVEKLEISEEAGEGVKTIFKAIFTVVKKAIELVGEAAAIFGTLAGAIGSGVLYILERIGKFANEFEDMGGSFNDFIDLVQEALSSLTSKRFSLEWVKELGEYFGGLFDAMDLNGFKRAFSAIGDAVLNGIGVIRSGIEKLVDIFKGAFEFIRGDAESFSDFISDIFDTLGSLFGEFVKGMGSLDGSTLATGGLFAMLGTGIFSGLSLKKSIGSFGGIFDTVQDAFKQFGSIGDSIGGMFDSLADGIKNLTGSTKADVLANIARSLLELAIAVAILTVSFVALSSIPWENIQKGLGALAGILTAVGLALVALSKIDIGGGDKGGLAGIIQAASKGPMLIGLSAALIGFGIAIGLLTGALYVLSKLSWEEIVKGLAGVLGLMVGLALAMRFMPEKKLFGTAGALIGMGIAVGILAFSLKRIAELSWEDIAKGLVATAGALAIFALASNLIGKSPIMKSAIALAIFSGSLQLLAMGIEALGKLDFESMSKALLAVSGALAIFTAMGAFMQPGPVIKFSIQLVALSLALVAFSKALQLMNSISWNDLGMGLLKILTLIGTMALVATTLPSGKIFALAVSMVALSVAIGAISLALRSLSGLDLGNVIKALLVIAGMMAIFSLLGQFAGPALAFAGTLIVVSVAIGVFSLATGLLVSVLAALTAIGLVKVAAGFVVLAAGLAVLALAANLLMPAIPALLLLSLAMLAIGAAAFLFAAGLALAATALVTLAAAGASALQIIPLFFEALGGAVVAFLKAIADSLVGIVDSLVDILVGLLGGIRDLLVKGGPIIVEVFVKLFQLIAEAITKALPEIGKVILAILETILDIIVEGIPMIVDKFYVLMTGIMDAISARLPELVDAFIRMMYMLASTIHNKGPEVRLAMKAVIWALVTEITNMHKDILSAAKSIGKAIIDGISNGISAGWSWLTGKVSNLAGDLMKAAKGKLGIASPSKEFYKIGEYVNQGFANGLDDKSNLPKNALVSIFDDMIRIVDDKTSTLGDKTAKIFSALTPTKKFESIAKEAVKARKEAFKARNEAVDAEEERLTEAIESAKSQISDAEEQAISVKEKTTESKKEAEDSKRDMKKSAQQSELDAKRAERKEQKRQKDISKARKDLRELEEKKAEFDSKKAGYRAGQAWADGVISGLTDDDGRIFSEAEFISQKLYEAYDEMKDDLSDFTGIFTELRASKNAIDSLFDSFKNLGRAVDRLGSSTSPRSVKRNLNAILDSMIDIMGAGGQVLSFFEGLEPYLPQIIQTFDKALPGIIPIVAQFAPQLASVLGGGLAAALPAIAGPLLGIVGVVVAFGAFFSDYAKDQKIFKFFKKIFDGVIAFAAKLPMLIVTFLRDVVKGFTQFIRDLPKILPYIIRSLIGLINQVITDLPKIISMLVDAVIDTLITLMTSPQIILNTFATIISAFIDGLSSFIGNVVKAAGAIADAIFAGIYTLIDKLPDMIPDLIMAFVNLIGTLITKLPSLLTAFVTGIIKLLTLLLTMPGRIVKLVFELGKALIQAIPKALIAFGRAGIALAKAIMSGIIDGLVALPSLILDVLIAAGDAVFGKILGIRTIWRNTMRRGLVGMKSGLNNFGRSIKGLLKLDDVSFDSGVPAQADQDAKDYAKNLKSAMQESMKDMGEVYSDDVNITVTPVIDMSEVDKTLANLSRETRFNPSLHNENIDDISAHHIARLKEYASGVEKNVTNINYTQNNTSAKPLRTIDIYRNTEKQLETV